MCIRDSIDTLKSKNIQPNEINPKLESLGESTISRNTRLERLLSRPNIRFEDIREAKAFESFFQKNNDDQEAIEQAEIQIKYSGYIQKEQENVEKFNRLESIKIPEDFNFSKIKSISSEGREKLTKIKPMTIGQASRISGVSPSDISVLLVYMGR